MGSSWFKASEYGADGASVTDFYPVRCCSRHFRGTARWVVQVLSSDFGVRQACPQAPASAPGPEVTLVSHKAP